MHSFWQDIRHGVRLLARSPGFAIAAIAMLALGVGSSTAVFGIVESVLLRPLPYPDSERIVTLSEVDEQGRRRAVSAPNFHDWAARAASFDAMAALRADSTTVVTSRKGQRISAVRFHGDVLRVFGIAVAHGRAFRTDEIPAGAPVAAVRYGFAKDVWGTAERALGEAIELGGVGFTIVGVLAPVPNERTDVYVPAAAFGPDSSTRGDRVWQVVARLRADTSRGAAGSEMQAIAQRLRAEHATDTTSVAVSSLLDDTVRGVRPALLALLAGAGLLLLVATANIANLLLARALGRRREIAVRQALGAGRGRVVRQIVVENLPLALVGAVAGITLAYWTFSGLIAMVPFGIPRRGQISLDMRALLFGLAVSLSAGLLFALAPALHTPRRRLTSELNAAGRTASGGGWLGKALVAGQFALALAVLVCAGLVAKSFVRMAQVDAGFDHARVLVGETELPETDYASEDRLKQFWRSVIDRVTAVPGVETVGVAESAPLDGSYPSATFELIDESGRRVTAWHNLATAGFFRALDIPVVRGRLFDERESHAAVVNQLAAERFWPGQDPLGRRVRMEGDGGEPLTIVGVIGDIRHRTPAAEPVPEIYGQFFDAPSRARDADLVIAAANPAALSSAIRGQFEALDAGLPVRFHTLDSSYRGTLAQPRFLAMLIGFFAACALLLAAAGLYSSMAYAVSRQTREIGIRLALGGAPRAVRREVLAVAMRIAALGLVIGTMLGAGGGQLVGSQLFGVPPGDPGVFVAAAVVLAATALGAAYLPALRASRTDPIDALRHE